MAHEIIILAIDDCVGLSVFSPTDLFHTANLLNRHEGGNNNVFCTRIVSVDGKPVTTSTGHRFEVEGSLQDVHEPAVLILPGISMESPERLMARVQELKPMAAEVKQRITSKTILAASCTGTLLAAQTGLLTNKRATTTWWIEELFQQSFPEVHLDADEILIDEGNVITSSAGASSLDLSLYLISRLAGPHLSRMCARVMVIDNSRQAQSPNTIPWHEKAHDPFIEKADAWIRKQPKADCKVELLAAELGVSPRTLLRRFKEQTGETPQQYILDIKMELVRHQLESNRDSIASIAADFGFSDENALRRSFAMHSGISPTQYRKQFHNKLPPFRL